MEFTYPSCITTPNTSIHDVNHNVNCFQVVQQWGFLYSAIFAGVISGEFEERAAYATELESKRAKAELKASRDAKMQSVWPLLFLP
jgi:hypothetical protein